MNLPVATTARALAGDKEPVRVASTANLALVGLLEVDDVETDVGDRVLVKDQTDATENGIYIASEGTWRRAPDASTSRLLTRGMKVTVQEGTENANSVWNCATIEPDIGDDPIEFDFYLSTDTLGVIQQATEDFADMADDIIATALAATGAAEYASRAVADITAIPTGLTYIRTAGYTSAGDGGGALYKKLGAPPSPAKLWHFQSSDGAWWEEVADYANPRTLGARGDGTTADDAAFDAAHAFKTHVIITPGTYRLTASSTWPAAKTYQFLPGAQLSVDSGDTITIRGVVEAPPTHRIFAGLGTVTGIRSVYVEWFGAKGDYNDSTNTVTTDSQPAAQKAVDCVANSNDSDGDEQEVIFGRGNYSFSKGVWITPSFLFSFRLRGAGVMNSGTRIYPVSAGFVTTNPQSCVIYIDNSSSTTGQVVDFKVQDLCVAAPIIGGVATTNCECGIWCGYSAVTQTLNPLNTVLLENVVSMNFAVCLRLLNMRLFTIERCAFWSEQRTGTTLLQIERANNGTAGDTDISNCRFVTKNGDATSNGIHVKAEFAGGGVSGLSVSRCIFYHSGKGIWLDARNGNISDVWIGDRCQFDTCNVAIYGEVLAASTNSYIARLNIGQIYVQTAGADLGHKGVQLQQNGGAGCYIRTVTITDGLYNGIYGINLELYKVDHFTISGNRISDGAVGVDAISVHSCKNGVIANNVGFASAGVALCDDFIQLDNAASDNISAHHNRATGFYTGTCVDNATTLGSPDIVVHENY